MKNKWLIKYVLSTFIGVLMVVGIPLRMYSQVNVGGEPYSFKHELPKQIPVEVMPPIDINKLKAEDESDPNDGLPHRFGHSFKVGFNLKNSGNWTELDNGNRVWQLKIECPDARSINLTYDHFWLPKGAVLYIYSPDKSQTLGGFTMQNNKGQKADKRGFATSFIKDDQIILEYYEPANVKGEGVISINKIVHGYRQLGQNKDFGDAGDCQVNVNCIEGAHWQEEKRAIAIMVIDGDRECSGSLINNTCGNLDPLFLTADHCFGPSGHDAIGQNNGDDLMFLWDYEGEGCPNPDDEPDFLTTSGATLLASDNAATSSDFALLRLDEDPANLGNDFVPYYVGWDRTGVLSLGGVGIHHPSADIKKISTHTMVPTGECGVAHGAIPRWLEVFWDPTTNGHGVTEGGSSGSPLFDSSHRILGQVRGSNSCTGNVDCFNAAADETVYGAITWSWTNSGVTDSRRRLRDWLDPCGSGVTLLDGISGCAVNHNLVSTLNWPIEFEAQNEITATNTIIAGSNTGLGVRYDAGSSVLLLPGFDAMTGSSFEAYIDGCGGANPAREAVSYTGNHVATSAYDKSLDKSQISFKNYPNPFTGQTTIEFTLPKDTPVTLSVSDVTGKQIAVLLNNEQRTRGTHQIIFDGNAHPAGMYYYTIQAGDYVATQRMTLMK